MNKVIRLLLHLSFVLIASTAFCLEVYTIDGTAHSYNLAQLRTLRQETFSTHRFKHDQNLDETWQGINLQHWLNNNAFTDFQSIRLESNDNYMVRVHKVELDTMPGFIVLAKNSKQLDSTEIRVIFPGHRDMFWVSGISRIYLEDFRPMPAPQQIFVWDSVSAEIKFSEDLKPFAGMSGYFFDDAMSGIFHADTGSVVFFCRDGLRSRLEYPKHLQGAILEKTVDGSINLKSPAIPAGMWLKDITYMQCGPYATVRYDYLYRLPDLAKTLAWKLNKPLDTVIKASVSRQEIKLETLYTPGSQLIKPGDWIELP